MYALSERLPVLTLAGSVVERMRMLLERGKTPVAGIRLGVANAGCSGMSYKTGYADGVRYGDKTIEEKGVKVFIDTGSGMFFFSGRGWIARRERFRRDSRLRIPTGLMPAEAGSSVVLRTA